MEIYNILWRNIKWRFHNPITIVLTVIQPVIWLLLYSTIAGQSMRNISGGNYTAFILPGLIVLITMACSSGSGYINFIMKSNGSFYRILISPIKRCSIIIGKFLESALVSYLEIAFLFIVSIFLSVRIPSFLGFLMSLPLIFLIAFFMSGLTYAISLSLPNEAVYETLMNLLVLSLFFTSTALFPLDKMQGGLKTAVIINPLTHMINLLRSLIIEASIDLEYYLFVVGLFLILCCFSFVLALWRLKKVTSN